mmetsp:Transcript_16539/g.27432  ORF Transcript_16539/g.27432 Transcript_16539/m.27432 type:complete len:286 (+) Transcript_16539:106-963(+)|eukprot:CAMPEP_0119009384 /NCGR_PEP_ID=MMETSP1176-20130426/4329_1 /TAXON_ID=265551 /ORGANISM="Synedropsis recta cf, Strain CCMP1620" /LENGTH=285 /DNA_ID=CAMNT_0006961893 /DNA_START=105 /DNA_END=962 /DNA_ORIENTATION=-
MTKTVLIAGATGYLGRFLVAEYMQRDDWNVIALVRKTEGAPTATKLVLAEVTKSETLKGIMDGGVDLVISVVGITRQRDGLTYQNVDYQANKNLLEEAIRAKVPRFAYIHVLKGESLAHLPAIKAKQDFVSDLEQATLDGKIDKATVICPCGFFSDMKDFLDMAKGGRAWLFGDGNHTINPIHGEDLAKATADAIEEGRVTVDIGGPDIMTQRELAELAFDALGKQAKITFVWDSIRTGLIKALPWMTPLTIWGPAQFFLTAMGMDMVGECHGTHHLKDHFAQVV